MIFLELGGQNLRGEIIPCSLVYVKLNRKNGTDIANQ